MGRKRIDGNLGEDLFTFIARCVVLHGAGADPLGVRTTSSMAILLIIVLITIGLAARAGLYGRRWSIAESGEDSLLIDTCARCFVLVLISLLGLLALGISYGNVLGAVHTGR